MQSNECSLSDELQFADTAEYQHTVYTSTNIWNNPTLFQSIHKNGLNKFAYQKKFKNLAEKMSLEMKKHDLPISENLKNTIIKKSFEFFKFLKLIFKISRVSLKACFVICAYNFIKSELDSDLVDFDFVTQFFYQDFHFKKRTLGLYMHLYRRNFESKPQISFEKNLSQLTWQFAEKFFNETENEDHWDSYSQKCEEFVKKIFNFSLELNAELMTKKVKNLAATFSYLFISIYLNVSISIKNYFEILQKSPTTSFMEQNNPQKTQKTKLFQSVCYNSVTNVQLKIITFFKNFFIENIFKNMHSVNEFTRTSAKLKEDILFLSSNINDYGFVKKNFMTLIKVSLMAKKIKTNQIQNAKKVPEIE